MRYPLLIVLIISLSLTAGAQDNPTAKKKKIITESAGRPDVPGDLMIEFGFNTLINNPREMSLDFWGSRFFNAYYLASKTIGSKGLSFHPGFGISNNRYALNDPVTIGYTFEGEQRSMDLLPLKDELPNAISFASSTFSTTHANLMMEFRFNSRPFDHKRSIKFVLGGTAGYMIDSKTRVRYREFGETKVAKQKESFQLNFFRYGAYTRLGYGNVYLHYQYFFSQIFQRGEGPLGTEATPMVFGVSIGLF